MSSISKQQQLTVLGKFVKKRLIDLDLTAREFCKLARYPLQAYNLQLYGKLIVSEEHISKLTAHLQLTGALLQEFNTIVALYNSQFLDSNEYKHILKHLSAIDCTLITMLASTLPNMSIEDKVTIQALVNRYK